VERSLSEKELEDINFRNLCLFYREELMNIYNSGNLPTGSWSQKTNLSKRFIKSGLIKKKQQKLVIGKIFYELTPAALEALKLERPKT
jgi:hypothetical protein